MNQYEKGTFGYWWTVTNGNSDIEGKVYPQAISCGFNRLVSFEGIPISIGKDFDCSNNQLTQEIVDELKSEYNGVLDIGFRKGKK